MRVLLDTCAVSELQRQKPNQSVVSAIEGIASRDLYISVLTVGEIIKGIKLLQDGKKKTDLQHWVQSLETNYGDRILDIDLETTRIWGELIAHCQKEGITIPAVDGLISATARRHGLHLMTRNSDHFKPTGVLLTNPWQN